MKFRPLVSLALAFASGIAAAALLPWMLRIALLLSALVSLFLLTTRRGTWLPWALILAANLLGALDYTLHVSPNPDDVSVLAPAVVSLTGVVQNDPIVLAHDATAGHGFARLTLGQVRTDATPETIAPPATLSGSVQVRLILPDSPSDRSTSLRVPRYGEAVAVHGRLETPSGPRNPGGFDERSYLAVNGVRSTLVVNRPNDWRLLTDGGPGGNPVRALAYRVRQSLLRHTRDKFSAEHGAVLAGVLLGERSSVPAAMREDLERTGTTHILATAGLHVGVVMALLLALFRLCRLPRKPAALLTILLILLYIPMTGERAAMTRAAIIAVIYLGAILLEREPHLPSSLAAAALILLVGRPQSLFEAGFQLSFGIVISIALALPILERLTRAVNPAPETPAPVRAAANFLKSIVLLALAAQLGALPLTAYYFHEISIVGLVANVLIVPLVFPVVALGFAGALLGAVAPAAAAPLDWLNDELIGCIVSISHRLAQPDWAVFSVGGFSPWICCVAYALLWGGAWRMASVKAAPENS